MQLQTQPEREVRHSSVPYVLPFAVFIAFLAIQRYAPLPPHADLIVRTIVLSGVLLFASRRVIDSHVWQPGPSILLGIAVFAIWIAPDLLFPAYRHHWLFENPVLGTLGSTFDPSLRHDGLAIALRFFRAVVLVPVIEELFWRGWLLRWLINPHFEDLPRGAYTAGSFWIVAVLFASEHGPYWDVGLIAGVLYNWWMIRTKSLGDCIVAHAVTNLCLSVYVIASGQWQYWL